MANCPYSSDAPQPKPKTPAPSTFPNPQSGRGARAAKNRRQGRKIICLMSANPAAMRAPSDRPPRPLPTADSGFPAQRFAVLPSYLSKFIKSFLCLKNRKAQALRSAMSKLKPSLPAIVSIPRPTLKKALPAVLLSHESQIY